MDFDLLNALANLEKSGGVVALPGDASYALYCRLENPASIARIRRMTGSQTPMFLLGQELDAFRPYLQPLPAKAESLAQTYWPAPLMLVLNLDPAATSPMPDASSTSPNTSNPSFGVSNQTPGAFNKCPDGSNTSLTLPEGLTTERQVAIMQPFSLRVRDLLTLIPGGILAASMASRYDEEAAKTAIDVYNTFGDDVDYVLNDDESLQGMLPATIASVDPQGVVQVLRSGPIVLD